MCSSCTTDVPKCIVRSAAGGTQTATAARDVIGHERTTALADRGYYNGEDILRCEQVGITTLVPKPLTSNSKAAGLFDKRDFIYDAKRDEYGSSHFLTNTLPRVQTEMSLHVLAYNLKRMLQIFGTQTLVAFMKA